MFIKVFLISRWAAAADMEERSRNRKSRLIDKIEQRTEIRQEPRNRRKDIKQCIEYVRKQTKQTNEEKPESIAG